MSTEFICLYRQATAAEALDRVRRSEVPADLLTTVFVMDSHRRLEGSVPIAALVRADPDASLLELGAPASQTLRADADFEEVARLMADFNLTAAAVVDDERRMIGVITVDDVLETMLPKGWRRTFGLLGEE
jgi:magnesium transporter